MIGGEYIESEETEDGIWASCLFVSGARDIYLNETREEMP
jgi:hypothetical protein